VEAFLNSNDVKEKYLDRINAHAKADEIIKGQYWEDGRGCAVGCTIHGSNHAAYETEIGVPEWLARLEDKIFEGLPLEKAKTFPVQFLEAINVGADLNSIKMPMLVFMVEQARQYANTEKSIAAIDGVLTELKRDVLDLDKLRLARIAADATYAASTHAGVADVAAYVAAYAAGVAAADAAYAAAYDAYAAGVAAADAAYAAAYDADAAAYDAYAAAYAAAYDADAAAYVAYATDVAAADAAYAAAYAAGVAAAYVAAYAAGVADVAAYAVAYAAGVAAADAAYAAAYAAGVAGVADVAAYAAAYAAGVAAADAAYAAASDAGVAGVADAYAAAGVTKSNQYVIISNKLLELIRDCKPK